MLPKVANTILHHTSRAVAAVQGQTGYAFRNVLQTSSGGSTTANWTGASSSGWGGAGAGAGGAKYHSSSRFYGYTGAGRAITQANQSAVNDSGNSQNDDNDDVHFTSGTSHAPRKFRARSNSLALGSQGKDERADKLGVLKVVQMHARANHAFASDNADTFDLSESNSSRPTLVRRNSTSTTTTSVSLGDPDLSLSTASHAHQQADPSDPAAPQTVTPPFEDNPEDVLKVRKVLHGYLSKDSDGAPSYVEDMLDNNRMPADITSYDMALEALITNRQRGTPIDLIVRVYDDLIGRGLIATSRTYTAMIKALGDRDLEVQKAISSVNARMKRREISGRATGVQQDADLDRLTKLRAESNIQPALSLFQSACAARLTLSQLVYVTLIRSCAIHSDEYAALRVFDYLEKRYPNHIPVAAFYHMLSLYGNIRNADAALETFNEFRKASKDGRIVAREEHSEDGEAISIPIYYSSPWNKMIEVYFKCGRPTEALSVLEEMMDSKGPKSGVPLPSGSTFHTIISGFCQSGDISTGLTWFHRLLEEDEGPENPYTPVSKPPRPALYMWHDMLETLIEHGMVGELNELICMWLDRFASDGSTFTPMDRLSVTEANLRYMEIQPDLSFEEVSSKLDFIQDRVVGGATNWYPSLGTQGPRTCGRIVQLYERYNELDKATSVLLSYVEGQKTMFTEPRTGVENEGNKMRFMIWLRKLALNTTERLMCREGQRLNFTQAKRLLALIREIGMFPGVTLADAYIAIYEDAKEKGQVGPLTQQDIEYLIAAGVTLSYVKPGNEAVDGGRSLARFESLLVDMTRHVDELSSLSNTTFEGILRALLSWYSEKDLHDVFGKLGPAWQAAWNHTKAQRVFSKLTNTDEKFKVAELVTEPSVITPPGSQASNFKTSPILSRSLDDILANYRNPAPMKAYDQFMASFRQGTYPFPDTLGRLINALGREKQIEKVRFIYSAAQHALAVRETETSTPQSEAWFEVEDQMIVALSHAGDIDGAHAHRHRVLESGGAPSADAYGALIRCVKDTTDDSANAYSLFRESQIRGVVPNVYLYNTMISKLAKARKADYAMDLFHKMKANGYWPSSVSYGAIIGACCRVGDYQSAELLFQEMSIQHNFKPRIPPYNTMMQLYTYTKPNRERVLYYYNTLLKTQVQPTAHTYKLLMDAYGTIEPIDLNAMEDTFRHLCADPNVNVQGTHWGSLINAYGCVEKDLSKAIKVFDSIASHQSTLASGYPLPDAVTYEALINVFVTLRSIDLIPAYMQRLESSGVHMTAYIANLLIKGYAVAGDLERARQVFESLEDPKQGVAGSYNHASHKSSYSTGVNAPVYREPSTWEAMVRAELGNGNREEAVALLERMRARQFPAAVYSRISGIMLDDAVSPWSSTATSSSPEISS